MPRLRIGRFGMGAVAAAIAMSVFVPRAARADVPIAAVGWWTRSAIPPSVPDGGIAVGVAPDGALSVGAIRLNLGGGATDVSLKLVEVGGQGQQVAAIQACLAENPWSSDKGGDLSRAPKDQCSAGSVTLTRAEDGTWSGKIGELVGDRTGEASLIVMPAATPTPSVWFQISFAPPVVPGTVSQGKAGDTGSPSTGNRAVPASDSAAATSGLTGLSEPPPDLAVAATPSNGRPTSGAAQADIGPSGNQSSDHVAAGAASDLGEANSGHGVNRLAVFLWLLVGLPIVGVLAAAQSLRAEEKLRLRPLLDLIKRS